MARDVDVLREPTTDLQHLVRRLAEEAMSAIHHDIGENEPEYVHEIESLERRFTKVVKAFLTKKKKRAAARTPRRSGPGASETVPAVTPDDPATSRPDVDDIIRRGDRVDFRAYLRTATPQEASLAWIKASTARMPDMAAEAMARMQDEPTGS